MANSHPTSLKIVFANIYQGLIYQGKKAQIEVFSQLQPSRYQEQYLSYHPDVVCLAEAPLDDEHGHSQFLDQFARAMGAVVHHADVHGKSWLVEGKYYGNAILSRLPLADYRAFTLPNPRLEADQPSGQHWIMHDKSVQSATIHLVDQHIRLFNLHYYPFHHFGRDLSEPEFHPIRQAFIDELHLEQDLPTVIAGDFNNDSSELGAAYPELFAHQTFATAATFGPEQLDERYNGRHQMDHILYTPAHLAIRTAEIVRDSSDHRGIVAEIALRT